MKTPPLVLCGLLSASLLVSGVCRSAEPTPAGVVSPKKTAKAAPGKSGGKTTQRKGVGDKAGEKTTEKAKPAAPFPPAPLFGLGFPALNLSTQLQPPSRPGPAQPAPAPVPTPFLRPAPVLAYVPAEAPAPPRGPAASQASRPGPAPARPRYQTALIPPPVVPGGPNPYLTPQRVNDPFREWGEVFAGLGLVAQPANSAAKKAPAQGPKLALPSLPSLPPLLPEGLSVLPVIKTVYPTGEKPLVIVTFKCPTELIGITPLPTKALHDIVTWGMDGINSTNLLAFNMQQVCQ